MTSYDKFTRWIKLLAVIVAAMGITNIVIEVTDDGTTRVIIGQAEKPAVPVAIAVDGPDQNVAPDTPLILDREAREVMQNAQATPERFDLAGDLRGTDESGPVAEVTGPLATPNFPGCTTRMLPTNWSARTVSISQVDGIGVHYTAGGNRPGLSDMNGLTGYASSPVAGVSWHFLIDEEGHCYYQVPLGSKAWTIGNLNSQTVNIEVIGRGNEPSFPAASAGQKKLSQVISRLGKKLDIPMRLGAVSNCTVTKSGVITHWMGGACAGGHHDIRPYSIQTIANRAAIYQRNSGCNKACRRAREVREIKTSNRKNHKARRDLNCAPLRDTLSQNCRTLHRQHGAIHNGAKRVKVKIR